MCPEGTKNFRCTRLARSAARIFIVFSRDSPVDSDIAPSGCQHLAGPSRDTGLQNMSSPARAASISLWERHGKNLLMLQPFMDSLIEGGDGCYLIDADGRRILDLAA